jgi:hypothetical protein
MQYLKRMNRIRVDDLHANWTKHPKYRREYEALEEEFSRFAARIRARTPSRLTPKQVTRPSVGLGSN